MYVVDKCISLHQIWYITCHVYITDVTNLYHMLPLRAMLNKILGSAYIMLVNPVHPQNTTIHSNLLRAECSWEVFEHVCIFVIHQQITLASWRDSRSRKANTFSFHMINSSPPGQNGRHFADDSFKCILLYGTFHVFIRIAHKFVHADPIDWRIYVAPGGMSQCYGFGWPGEAKVQAPVAKVLMYFFRRLSSARGGLISVILRVQFTVTQHWFR